LPISRPVLAYYRDRIFAKMGRDRVPPNFEPRADTPDGFSTVDGCRARGKNILELSIWLTAGHAGEEAQIADVRVGCGLCNPAMYVASDLLADFARGQTAGVLLALDPLAPSTLDPLFAALAPEDDEERPEDAREKFQYGLIALQNAVRSAVGHAPVEVPEIAEPGAWEHAD